MILGMDVSSTVVGYCIMDNNGEIVKLSYHRFNEDLSMLDKGKELECLINQLTTDYTIKHFFIEERLKAFRAGGTNMQSMLKLIQVNFLTQYLVNLKNIPIVELNVNSLRAKIFPGFHKIARAVKGTKQKEVAFEMAVSFLGESVFPTKIMKSGKRKGEAVFIDESRDMADAWAVARCGYIINGNK